MYSPTIPGDLHHNDSCACSPPLVDANRRLQLMGPGAHFSRNVSEIQNIKMDHIHGSQTFNCLMGEGRNSFSFRFVRARPQRLTDDDDDGDDDDHDDGDADDGQDDDDDGAKQESDRGSCRYVATTPDDTMIHGKR